MLTQLDLSILLRVCDAVVNTKYINEIQRDGRLLPTRGNVHDLSGAIPARSLTSTRATSTSPSSASDPLSQRFEFSCQSLTAPDSVQESRQNAPET